MENPIITLHRAQDSSNKSLLQSEGLCPTAQCQEALPPMEVPVISEYSSSGLQVALKSQNPHSSGDTSAPPGTLMAGTMHLHV